MTSIRSITHEEQLELKNLHSNIEQAAKLTGCSTAAAAFLLIGALIVITCGCLCLMIPGINVISNVILPAVVPGIISIIISIPFIILAVKHSLNTEAIHKKLIDRIVTHIETYSIYNEERKVRVKFILKNFLNWESQGPNTLIKNRDWSVNYQNKILSNITERLPKEKKQQDARQKKIAKALDKARAKVSK